MFVMLVLGLMLRYHPLFVIIIIVITLIFLLCRFRKRLTVVAILFTLIGTGISFIKFDFNKPTYMGLIVDARENYFLLNSSFEKLYVYDKNNNYEIGDIVEISGYKTPISFTSTESSFSFQKYLEDKGVYYQLHINKIETKFSNPIRINSLKNGFLSHFKDERTSHLVSGILFSDLGDDNTIDNIKSLHLSRLLSTCGIYIAIFYKFLCLLFSFIFKEKTSRILSISLIGVYSIFVFPKFSVMRFMLLTIMKLFNEYKLKKKYSYLTLVSISGFFFILIDYHLTYSLSFILGYSIPILNYFLNAFLYRYKKYKRNIIRYILLLLFFIPIELSIYNELSLLTYIVQLLLTPLFLLFGVLSFISFLGLPIYPVISHFTNAISNITYYINYINFTVYAPPLNEVFLSLYFLIYFILILMIDIRHKRMKNLIITLYLSSFALYLSPIKNLFTNEVVFINVGQGDATLIRNKFATILIDTGGSMYTDLATNSLIPFLKKKQIYNIDLLITTHDDFDHSGAVTSLRNNFKVKTYIKDYNNFPIKIGDIALNNYNNYIDEFKEENDESLVIGFNLSNVNFLITGDAPKKIENRIIKDYSYIPCDILKVGHHGSNTSTSENFITYLKPKEAIISCGKDNKYGHPHQVVINTLKKYDIKIRRTDIEGSITYSYLTI